MKEIETLVPHCGMGVFCCVGVGWEESPDSGVKSGLEKDRLQLSPDLRVRVRGMESCSGSRGSSPDLNRDRDARCPMPSPDSQWR